MLKNTPSADCDLCSDGLVVAVVPAGPCKGLRVCEKCSLSLSESTPFGAEGEASSRPHEVVELRAASPAFDCAVLATGYGRAVRALLEELPRAIDHGEVRQVSWLPDLVAVVVWHELAGERMGELLEALRVAASAAGADLRIAADVVRAEREAEQCAAEDDALDEATDYVTADTMPSPAVPS